MSDAVLTMLPRVSPTKPALANEIRTRLDAKTKPPGSLGQLEELAVRVACAQDTGSPQVRRPAVIVCAGDHGLVAEGVSAWPQSVTVEMVRNMLAGGAAINAIAASAGVTVTVVDAGVAVALDDAPSLVQRAAGRGTASALVRPAMSAQAREVALANGVALASTEIDAGTTVLALGDMGIGNTSAAALIMSLLLDLPVRECAGLGAGLDEAGLARKCDVLERTRARVLDVLAGLSPGSGEAARVVLAECGGFEIATMAGAMIGAASRRVPVLVDGFIAGAAALVACRLEPALDDYLIWCHRSAERGHDRLLDVVGASPLLDLGLRLGEGTGAALAVPLLRAAVAVLNDMASFDEAGVSGRE